MKGIQPTVGNEFDATRLDFAFPILIWGLPNIDSEPTAPVVRLKAGLSTPVQ